MTNAFSIDNTNWINNSTTLNRGISFRCFDDLLSDRIFTDEMDECIILILPDFLLFVKLYFLLNMKSNVMIYAT